MSHLGKAVLSDAQFSTLTMHGRRGRALRLINNQLSNRRKNFKSEQQARELDPEFSRLESEAQRIRACR